MGPNLRYKKALLNKEDKVNTLRKVEKGGVKIAYISLKLF